MRIYYFNDEYEPGKHKIVAVWSAKFLQARPEDSTKTIPNKPYSVIEFDEDYNPELARNISTNSRFGLKNLPPLPDKFYINGTGQICNSDTNDVVSIVPNKNKEDWNKGHLSGKTPDQIDADIDKINNIAEVKEKLKKQAKLLSTIAKQVNLE